MVYISMSYVAFDRRCDGADRPDSGDPNLPSNEP